MSSVDRRPQHDVRQTQHSGDKLKQQILQLFPYLLAESVYILQISSMHMSGLDLLCLLENMSGLTRQRMLFIFFFVIMISGAFLTFRSGPTYTGTRATQGLPNLWYCCRHEGGQMLSGSILRIKIKKNLPLKLLYSTELLPASVLNIVRLYPPENQTKSGVFLPLVP